MAEKSFTIHGGVDLDTAEAEKKKKQLEKPIKTNIEIDTSKIESSLASLEKSLKRVITGNEQYGYKIKIDTSGLDDAQKDIEKLRKLFQLTLKKYKADNGKIFYKVQVEGIDKIQQSFQQLTTIVDQFKDQMNSINGRSVREIETDIARVNSVQSAMKKLVAAPVENLFDNLKDGGASQKSINLFLKNVDDYVTAGGKLKGLKTRAGNYDLSSILGELNNQGFISDDRLQNYLQAGSIQADNFKITLQGLNAELEKAKTHEDKDFNVGFKQEDIDRLADAFSQLDGKSIGLSEDQVNNITNSFTQLQTVLENIRDTLSSFDIPKLESPKTVKIFDGVKEQIFDVEKDADALKKKLQEMANSMSTPQFNKGSTNKGDDLQNIIKHNKPGTLGTGLYTQSNYLDVVKWKTKGLRAFDLGQYSSNLLHFADDDELNSFMVDFSNKLNSYVLKMSKFGDIVDPKTIKSVDNISDIDGLYESIKIWCDKLNVDLEGLKSFVAEEINYVNSFLDVSDMRQQGQKTPVSNFLKNVLGKNGIDVTRTANSDNTNVGSMLIDLNKTSSYIDFGENYDVGRIFYDMVLEKIAKQKSNVSDFYVEDFIKDWVPEDLQKIPEFVERIKSEFAKGQALAKQASFDELNTDLSKVTANTVEEISPKSADQVIGFNEQDIQRIVQAFTELKTILEQIHSIMSGEKEQQQIGLNEQDIQRISEAFNQLKDSLTQIHDKIPDLSSLGEAIGENTNIDAMLTKIGETLSKLDGESISSISNMFTNMKISDKDVDNIFNLAVALETLGTAIGELANTKGFNETLTPINELLKNAEQQLKNLSTIVSASTSKIKQTQEQAIGKEYSSKDYINDIKNYYKYLEKAKTQELKGSEDKDSQFLADQYYQKTLQYAEQINEKRRQGVELTDDELKAFETRTNAQKKYLESIDKVRARQEEIQKPEKEKAISEYMKNTGTDTAVRSAQNLIKQNIDNEDTAIQGQVTKLRDLINSLEKEVGELNTKFEGTKIPEGATAGVDKLRRDIKAASQELREMVSGQNIKMADPGNIARATKNFESWLSCNPKAAKAYADEIETIKKSLSGDLNVDQFKDVQQQIDGLITKANQANNIGKTFSDTLKGSFGNLARYLMTFASFYQVINVFKQAVGVVKELDSALTEMRKVSDESISSLKQYQLDTFNMADKVGTTAQQIQNSTADWLRLGKSFKDAQELAMQSTVLLNVSEFTDIQQATDQLVSATQAYDELDASAITDKLNIIGNNFAVGTSDLASGLQNAAAVLKTQGNDIDQAVALLTTGNLIGQDMSKQSAGIRTISLRIAGKRICPNTQQCVGILYTRQQL